MTRISNPEPYRPLSTSTNPLQAGPLCPAEAPDAIKPTASCKVSPAGPIDLGDISFLDMGSTSNLCQLDFVENSPNGAADLEAISQRLSTQLTPELGPKLNQIASTLPAEAAQNLNHLAKLVSDPKAFAESLDFLLKNPGLDPAVRDQFARLAGLITEINAESNKIPPDPAALNALLTGTPAKGPDFPLSTALGYAEQSLVFDSHMQKHQAREAVPKILNQAFSEAIKVMRSGQFHSPIALRNAVMNQVESELAQRNRSRLENVFTGKYQTLINNLQTRFAHNMQNVPGFKEAVAEAATAAGIPFASPDQLANPEILGQIPTDLLDKTVRHLNSRLLFLESNSATESESSRRQIEPLRQALRTLLKEDLPVISTVRSEYKEMRAHFIGYADELKTDLLGAVEEMGLELPADYLNTYTGDPQKASEIFDNWLSTQKTAAAGNPEKLHKLENLKLFSTHLEKLSLITNRIDRSEPIEPQLLDSYERFQTFILAKRAILQSFEMASEQDKPHLRKAVLNLGQRFAALSDLPPGAMQQELFKWLSQSGVSRESINQLASSLQGVRHSLEAISDSGEFSRQTGVNLNPDLTPPARLESDTLLRHHDQSLNQTALADSAYLRDVFERLGEEALLSAVRSDLKQVFNPMANRLSALMDAIKQIADRPFNLSLPKADKLEQQELKTANTEVQQADLNSLPDALALEQRLATAQAQQRLKQEVEAIKQELIQSLRDQRLQAKQMDSARRLRDQLQTQIFELHNSRNQTEQRHRLESLEEINAQLQELGVK